MDEFFICEPVDFVYAMIKSFLFGAGSRWCAAITACAPGMSINAVPKGRDQRGDAGTLLVLLSTSFRLSGFRPGFLRPGDRQAVSQAESTVQRDSGSGASPQGVGLG